MSTYGNEPPPDPHGHRPDGAWSPPPPPPPPPPTNPYGQTPTYGARAGDAGHALPYSFWGRRVGASLIDGMLTLAASFPAIIGAVVIAVTAEPITTVTNADGSLTTTGGDDANPVGFLLILVGSVTYIGFFVYNQFIKQGRTGYTIGKGVLDIKLVREADGTPIGAGMAFVRQICHILDGFCYVGYLWPLWDSKRQTFADKIINTVVLDIPKP